MRDRTVLILAESSGLWRAQTCSKVDLSTMIGLRTKSSRVGLSDGLAFFAVPGLT